MERQCSFLREDKTEMVTPTHINLTVTFFTRLLHVDKFIQVIINTLINTCHKMVHEFTHTRMFYSDPKNCTSQLKAPITPKIPERFIYKK